MTPSSSTGLRSPVASGLSLTGRRPVLLMVAGIGSGGGRRPRVSIGLPVYNAAEYLAETLGCYLEQTFEDFELIVGDNASTDGTAEIVAEFVATDRRVVLLRHERNLGANRNYNTVAVRSRGELFKWAAHDDLVLPIDLLSAASSCSTMIPAPRLPTRPRR